MSGAAKIAIGCGVVVVMGGVVLVGAVVGGAYWVKGKASTFVASAEKVEKLREEAEANPFTPPADGILQESRLDAYLTVRKSQTAFLDGRSGQIAAANKRLSVPGATASFSDIAEGAKFIGDLQQNFYGALAAEKMSHAEYRWIVFEVYRAEFASEVENKNEGKTPSQVTTEAADSARLAMEEHQNDPQDPNLPPEMKQGADAMKDAMKDIAAKAKSGSAALDPPQANVELVRKHDADIRKYALSGNESAGF